MDLSRRGVGVCSGSCVALEELANWPSWSQKGMGRIPVGSYLVASQQKVNWGVIDSAFRTP
jgi:hypothetical protein